VPEQTYRERFFASRMYFRLWCAQVVSSMGDWMGFLAIAAAATRIGAGSPETAVGLVMSARIVPGLFLGPAAGVLVDRWDRKKVMVTCDIIRAGTLALLPFISHVWQLLIASLILEVCTLMWSTAKEASVPNLVPEDRLTTANSLSLIAAYGTFPFASLFFALLAAVAQQLGHIDALGWLGIRQESVAFWFDSLTFLVSATIIWRLALPRLSRRQREAENLGARAEWTQAFAELKEGWRFIFANPVVRAVNVGLAVGLIGGGMLVPLGPVFSIDVLGAGSPGFGLLTTALGFGVAIGILVVSVLQKRVPKEQVFSAALVVAGGSLIFAASVSWLSVALLAVGILGICTGTVYVLGFTLLHENVSDELRGRTFSALYMLVRLCVLVAFAFAPLLSQVLGDASDAVFQDSRFAIGGVSVFVPGVRITLWLAGAIILCGAALAVRSLRSVSGAPTSQAVSGGVSPQGRAPADA
jgi:dTMP kinase